MDKRARWFCTNICVCTRARVRRKVTSIITAASPTYEKYYRVINVIEHRHQEGTTGVVSITINNYFGTRASGGRLKLIESGQRAKMQNDVTCICINRLRRIAIAYKLPLLIRFTARTFFFFNEERRKNVVRVVEMHSTI